MPPARWQSGYAEDCKSSYIGSIPVRASIASATRLNRFALGHPLGRRDAVASREPASKGFVSPAVKNLARVLILLEFANRRMVPVEDA
jgi:hypothetical protein